MSGPVADSGNELQPMRAQDSGWGENGGGWVACYNRNLLYVLYLQYGVKLLLHLEE